MKKKAILLLMTVLTISISYAQSGRPKLTEEQKKEWAARMEAYKTRLNLSSEQEVKVEEVNIEYFKALGEIRNSGGTRLAKYKKFKEAKDRKDKKMKTILDKGQYKEYEKIQQEIAQEFRENRGR